MRERSLNNFLTINGMAKARRTKLAGDASSRRYERLYTADQTLILMDAPPPDNVKQFIKIARLLRGFGFSAPEIYASDVNQGFLLLEDMGDGLFVRLIENGYEEQYLYKLAVDFLLALTQSQTVDELPEFTDDYILEQNKLYLDWYVPEQYGVSASEEVRSEYAAIWLSLLGKIRVGTEVIVLRDFHSENLLLLPEREGLQALGLLDFQDALTGPAAYDLVSLLQDARRDVTPKVASDMIAYYIEKSGVDGASFRTAIAILGAHRCLRILGIFTRLAKQEGKTGYLKLIPRMLNHLQTNLTNPELAELKLFLTRLNRKSRQIG
jgi:N-acetylmuramate 1-kinase